MEKVVELTKETFSREFLRLVPKVTELSDVLWFLFKLGGSAQTDVIAARFPNFKQDLQNLLASGILEIKGDLVGFTEEFEEMLLSRDITQLSNSDITSILIENYRDKLLRNFNFNSFVDPLSTVLASVIVSSTPQQPAFMSRILRVTDNLFGESKQQYAVLADPKAVLDNFLNKSLDIVTYAGHYITLSDKAKQLIESNAELAEIYSKSMEEKLVRPKARKEPEISLEIKTEEGAVEEAVA